MIWNAMAMYLNYTTPMTSMAIVTLLYFTVYDVVEICIFVFMQIKDVVMHFFVILSALNVTDYVW